MEIFQIIKFLEDKEEKYIKKLPSKKLNRKTEKIQSFLLNTDHLNFYSKEDLKNLRNLAISEYGFIRNVYRKEFYKKVLLVNDYQVQFLYYDTEQNKSEFNKVIVSDEEINIDPSFITITPNDYIIEVDVKRSVVNHFVDRGKHDNELEVFKKELINILKLFFHLNKGRYNYYQGFHDIALYFFILFYNRKKVLLQVLQRISEFYLKDYLVSVGSSHFKFETVYKIITEITENIGPNISNFIKNNSDVADPLFSLPWILTIFCRDLHIINMVYRLFDYFLLSHPNVIYTLSSNIIIDEVATMKKDLEKRFRNKFDSFSYIVLII